MSEPIASEVTSVTFFEDRAEVRRKARAAVLAGANNRVRIAGVTPLVHDPSLQVRCGAAGVKVASARVIRRIEHEPGPGAAEVQGIEDQLREARRRREVAQRALERAHGDQQRSFSLEASWVEAARRVPDRAAEHAAEIAGALDQIDAALIAGLDAAHAAAAEVSRAQLDEQRAEQRLRLARTAQPRVVTFIEVQLEATAAADVDLELTYQTPCALWRPEHLATLDGDKLEIRTWATVWQRTGEAWCDVACRFSTARPAQPASPPLLADDLLTSRRKTAEERKTVVVEAREQAIQLAGVAGVRAVDEMPGVEDGGEPLWLEGARPATVPSDGQPVRVEVARVELSCKSERIAFAEVTQAVHLRAAATLVGKLPLLAGPVVLVRKTEAVGRGRTGFVAKGEPFELGFGVDDGLRVRRTKSEQRETTPVIGTQKITRSCELFLSNMGAEPRKVTLVERIPVSEVEGVEVKLLAWPGQGPDKDGFLRAEVELASGQTEQRSLSYRIEAAAKVQLPF